MRRDHRARAIARTTSRGTCPVGCAPIAGTNRCDCPYVTSVMTAMGTVYERPGSGYYRIGDADAPMSTTQKVALAGAGLLALYLLTR